jgi:hypothetical protein
MFDYKQRPATNEYRENWDRAFGPQSCSKPPAEHTPDAAGPLARTEVSGVPASIGCPHDFVVSGFAGAFYCIICDAPVVLAAPKTDKPFSCRCGSESFRRASRNPKIIVCSVCGEDLW